MNGLPWLALAGVGVAAILMTTSSAGPVKRGSERTTVATDDPGAACVAREPASVFAISGPATHSEENRHRLVDLFVDDSLAALAGYGTGGLRVVMTKIGGTSLRTPKTFEFLPVACPPPRPPKSGNAFEDAKSLSVWRRSVAALEDRAAKNLAKLEQFRTELHKLPPDGPVWVWPALRQLSPELQRARGSKLVAVFVEDESREAWGEWAGCCALHGSPVFVIGAWWSDLDTAMKRTAAMAFWLKSEGAGEVDIVEHDSVGIPPLS